MELGGVGAGGSLGWAAVVGTEAGRGTAQAFALREAARAIVKTLRPIWPAREQRSLLVGDRGTQVLIILIEG